VGEALAAVEEHAGVPRGRQCIVVTGDASETRRLVRPYIHGLLPGSVVGLHYWRGALDHTRQHLAVCKLAVCKPECSLLISA